MNATNDNVIQVRIVKVHGKARGQYRSPTASGEWSQNWFRMAVADARAALRTGTAHVGAVENCRVVAG